jgi:type IV pilus secretin PilQ/predicted competence protein
MKSHRTRLTILVAFFILIAYNSAGAAIKITALEVNDNTLRVDATGPLKFNVNSTDPFNIVVDLEGAELAAPQDRPITSKGLFSEIRAAQARDGQNNTRIDMVLSSPAVAEAKARGNSLFITLTRNDPKVDQRDAYSLTETTKRVTTEQIKPPITVLQPAKEVVALFIEKTVRGTDLVIKGDGAMPDPVFYRLGNSFIIEMERIDFKAYVPSTMISPIRKISHKKEKDLLRIEVELEPDGSSVYLEKYQEYKGEISVEGDEITLGITLREIGDKTSEGFTGKVDLDYSNADVKSVIQSIAIKAGYNWIIDENVSAAITIRQKAINWREAIKLIESNADVQVVIDDKTKTLHIKKSEFAKLGQPKEGDLVSFDFQDADLHSVIMLLSEVSGFNIIIHPDIKDIKYKVNTKIKNLTWQKALERIVKILALEYSVDEEDKLIVIAPIETINKIEEARQKIRDSRAKAYEAWSKLYAERSKIAQEKLKALMSEQKVTKIIRLKYISTFEAVKHITQLNIFRGVRSTVKAQQAGVAKQEQVETKITEAAIEAEVGLTQIDSINAIVVRHVPAIVEEIERFIKAIDVPSQSTQQVLIEARVVELSNTSAYELGVQWGVSGWGATKDGGILSFGGTRSARDTQSATDYATTPYAQVGIGQATQGTVNSSNMMPLIINMPAAVAQGAGGSFGIGYINRAASMMLDFRLSALERSGKGKILSQPKIMTLNNSASLIRHGARVPITTPGSTQGTYTTTYIDAALLMKVVPSIVFGTNENVIYLDLEISKDEPATSSDRKDILGNPQIDSRAINTRVALRDGETIVIGGIRRETISEGESNVPYLSKIPLLGNLFKKEDKTANTEELMIFVTPRIVQPIKQE